MNPLSAQLSALGNFATGSAGSCTVANPSGFGTSTENVFPYSTTGTLNPPLTTTSPLNNGLFKADYSVGTHNHFSGLYFLSRSVALANSQTQQLVPEWEVNVFNDVHQYDGTWTFTPNSNWVNDLRWGLVYMNNSRDYADQNLPANSPWPSGYGFNSGVTNPLYGGFPYIQISSLPTMELGAGPRSSIRGPEGDSDLVESVSYLHGKHAFKFGFEYVDVILDGDTYSGAQGAATFQNLATWLTGVPTKASILTGDPTEVARSHWYGTYAQDSWRLTNKVTLNLGLRWEYFGSLSVQNNYWGNFNPNAGSSTPAFQQFGPGEPLASEYTPEKRDFSPRVGVAWDVFGNGKTVVRAGGGVLRNGALEKSFLGASAPFGATFFGCSPAVPPSTNCPAANAVLIGPNNSGTAVSAHSSTTVSLSCSTANMCNNTATSLSGQLNWNLAGPVFPSVGAQTINGVSYTGQLCAPAGVGTGPCAVAAVDPNFRDPYSIQWNLDIQRAITNGLTIDVAYVGNHGADEMSQVDLNQPAIGTGWNTPTSTLPASQQLAGGVSPTAYCLASMTTGYNNCGGNKTVTAAVANLATAAGFYRSTFPYLSTIYEVTNGDISNYNALQVTLQGRNYHGLSFLSAYTYGHALSETDADVEGSTTVVPDKGNLRLLYGNSAGDLRNRFTFSPSYNIPGIKSPGQMLQGWSVSGILVLQSGQHWSPNDTSSTDYLGTGELGTGTTQNWNYLGKPSAFKVTATPIPCWGSAPGCATFASNPTVTAQCQAAATVPYGGPTTTNGQLALAALADSSCYIENGGVLTPPAYGTFGDAYNGIFTAQPYYNVDLSIAKTWKIKERYSAQFRAEFFNLFNRADWAASGSGGGTSPSGSNPTGSNFGVATVTPDATNPVTGGGPRHIQFGLKLSF